jgi:octaprenyl-diphosphate synthase
VIAQIRQPIEQELKILESRFQQLIKTDVALIKKIFNYIVLTKGKRLRPMLLFLCGNLQGKLTEKSYAAAVIVELLHTATLIHDDVVDNSELRRGSPSVNSIWDNKIAVLIGDYLFAEVLSGLSDLDDLKLIQVISNVTKQMSQGELLQMEKAQDFQMDEATYFRLISNKTASLTAATCQLGAMTSTQADPEHVGNLRVFGEKLGLAFQIKDDLLDFQGSTEKLGKPIGKDLLENIITLPILFSLNQVDQKTSAEILSLLNNGQMNRERIVAFVQQTGGIEYAMQQADHFIQQALECLDRYPDSPYKRSLILLANYITMRET